MRHICNVIQLEGGNEYRERRYDTDEGDDGEDEDEEGDD